MNHCLCCWNYVFLKKLQTWVANESPQLNYHVYKNRSTRTSSDRDCAFDPSLSKERRSCPKGNRLRSYLCVAQEWISKSKFHSINCGGGYRQGWGIYIWKVAALPSLLTDTRTYLLTHSTKVKVSLFSPNPGNNPSRPLCSATTKPELLLLDHVDRAIPWILYFPSLCSCRFLGEIATPGFETAIEVGWHCNRY